MSTKPTDPKPTILVVEDEHMLQEAYRHVLTFKGYTVHTASNGVEGLEQLRKVKPDIVLLDVLMPQLDGIGFLRQAEVKKNFPKTRVVACSNLSDAETREQMLSLGAERQVLKSDLSPAQLVELVEELSK
jgi:two-component system chemotaxis response regulator CheY